MTFLSRLALLFFAITACLPEAALARTTHCLVVRGDSPQADPKGTFKNEPFLAPHATFFGQECRQFEGWSDLYEFYTNRLSTLSPSENQIFVLLAAHGSGDGLHSTFVCNRGKVQEAEIQAVLNTMTRNHHVLFVNQGCFSGNLLLLEVGSRNEAESSNLCTIASSVVEAKSWNYTTDLPMSSNSPISAEELFRTYFGDGLISSAVYRMVLSDPAAGKDIVLFEEGMPFELRQITKNIPKIQVPTPMGPVLIGLQQDAFGNGDLDLGSWSPARHAKDWNSRVDHKDNAATSYVELFSNEYSKWISALESGKKERLYPTIAAIQSLSIPDKELAPIDLARRHACRAFILEETPPHPVTQEEFIPWSEQRLLNQAKINELEEQARAARNTGFFSWIHSKIF